MRLTKLKQSWTALLLHKKWLAVPSGSAGLLMSVLSVQVLRHAFDQAEAELDSCALDLTRSGTTAVLSIVTHDW